MLPRLAERPGRGEEVRLSVRATVFVPVSRRRGTVAAGAPDEAWAAVAAVGVGGDYDDADVADGPRKLEGG